MPHHSICACMFLLVTCLGGMRGYEATWTDESGLHYEIEICEKSEDYPAVSWPIVRCFKSHAGITGCYMILIVGETNPGIQFFKWIQRFLLALSRNGQDGD